MMHRLVKSIFVVGVMMCGGACYGQDVFESHKHLFSTPRHYQAIYTNVPPVIDGNISADVAWASVPWSELFVDIEGQRKPKPHYDTRMKITWNDSMLFIAARLQEPHIWATLKRHDAIIYHDNDFEVFIDPDNDTHQYFEIEINALNTILDLFMPKPYRNWAGALISYDVPQLRTAVGIQGTINDPSDTDSSWTVEMAIPFRALFIGNSWRPPSEGALWRINFSRVQWATEVREGVYIRKKDANGKVLSEYNWVWSPQGVINMHYPERWGYVQFLRKAGSDFKLPYTELQRRHLWLVYYRQKEYFGKQRHYAPSLKELGINSSGLKIEGIENILKMESTSNQFTVYIGHDKSVLSVNEQGFIQSQKKIP